MLRVLIVDDSAIMREMLTEILGSDPEIQVVATASDGEEGLRLTLKLKPDLVTMDIHMPVMNGFEATKEIMIENPTPIVIVSASTAVQEVEWAMQALQAGAVTLKLKPPGPGHPDFDASARDLVETVKAMAGIRVVRHQRRAHLVPETQRTRIKPPMTKARAVAIAASTGGPSALIRMLRDIAGDFPVPILLVQHIAEGFAEGFVHWLDNAIDLSVKIAVDGERLEPGMLYVAPSNKHLGLSAQMRVVLSDKPPIDGFRPSANHLFESCAEALSGQCVGVILTGMGCDGANGLRELDARGGHIIAQDEATSTVFGMPGSAIASGLADEVLPIDQIAHRLTRVVLRQD